jgi:hypothetical protein
MGEEQRSPIRERLQLEPMHYIVKFGIFAVAKWTLILIPSIKDSRQKGRIILQSLNRGPPFKRIIFMQKHLLKYLYRQHSFLGV